MAAFLATLFCAVCVLLVVVIMLQKGRGGGLGAAFGGAGSSAFGAKTGDVFTWVTIVLTALFLLLAIAATMAMRPARTVTLAPVFLPAPGVYTDAKHVTITCGTDLAKIYFTLDGTDPTDKSELYDSSVLVEPGTTLSAQAYRQGYKPSGITQGYYGPEIQAPIPEIPEAKAIELPTDGVDEATDAEAESTDAATEAVKDVQPADETVPAAK